MQVVNPKVNSSEKSRATINRKVGIFVLLVCAGSFVYLTKMSLIPSLLFIFIVLIVLALAWRHADKRILKSELLEPIEDDPVVH